MEATVEILENSDVVEIVYPEEVTAENLLEVINQVVSITKGGKLKCLADCTHIKSGHHLFDLYKVVDELRKRNIYNLKEAIITSQNDFVKSNADFYQLIGNNRGYEIQLFSTREEALDWLNKNF